MTAFRRMLAAAIVCLASLAGAQPADELAAARVLGPHWRQISRAAGMIFTGTMLAIEMRPATANRPLPIVEVRVRVDRAIAGVQPGQILTLREWEAAAASHRAMRGGQRLLLLLYPPSRLGLTSPVGGPLGQVELDSQGKAVATPILAPARSQTTRFPPPRRATGTSQTISLLQLERAIRSAREN